MFENQYFMAIMFEIENFHNFCKEEKLGNFLKLFLEFRN